MSLRIPLSPDQTLQTEFHEIERRLRRLERSVGETVGPTMITVTGQTAVPRFPGVGADLTTIYARLDALEAAMAAGDGSTSTIPVFGATGSMASDGLVPAPDIHEPPTGIGEQYLEEDATWSYPFRGLVAVTTDGTDAIDVVAVKGGLHVNGDASMTDLEVYNLHTHGDIEYNARFYDDLRFPATGFNPAGSTAPPAVLTTNGLLSFSGTVDNIIGGVAQMPHSWKEGTPLHPHIHVLFPTANPGTNTRWLLEYNVANVNDDFTTDSVTYTSLTVITVANANNIARAVMAEFEDIPMTGKTISACVLWRLSRLAASDGADDDTNACSLIEFDLHYEVDSPGSSSEYTK